MGEAQERIATWEYMHKEKSFGALSGCKYDETIDALKLDGFVSAQSCVLEIGVGLGYVTKELYKKVSILDVFDISPTALMRVADCCDDAYDLEHIEQLYTGKYDIIFCQNVVQHIPTPMLYYELFHFIRSLKPGGIMAIKSISTPKYEDTGDDSYLVIQGTKCSNSIGCFCRSVDYFKKIIDRCGGVAELIIERPCSVMFINAEQIFHIKKKIYD